MIVSPPRWIEVAHVIATHGQPTDERERIRRLWAGHVIDRAEEAGKSPGPAEVLRSCFCHVWRRATDGRPTVMPTGMLFLALAVIEFMIAVFDVSSDIGLWLELLLAVAAGLVGVLLIGWPNSLHPTLLAIGLFGISAALSAILLDFEFQAAGDYFLVAGSILAVVGLAGAGCGLVWPFSDGPSYWWTQPLWVASAGVLVLGVGNALWVGVSTDPVAVVSNFLAALATAAMALSIRRLALIAEAPR